MKKLHDFVGVLKDIMFILSVIGRIFMAYQRWEERKILEQRGYRRGDEVNTKRYYNATGMGFTAKW